MESHTWMSGDVLAFSGRGRMSRLIRWATCSRYTHVAVVAYVDKSDLGYVPPDVPLLLMEEWQPRPILFESTTLASDPCIFAGRPIAGAQAHEIDRRLAEYPGAVWLLRRKSHWTLDRRGSVWLARRLLSTIGRPYDEPGAALSATRLLKRWCCRWRAADRGSLYCVEQAAWALEPTLGPLAAAFQPGQMRPCDLVRLLVERGIYDEPERIK